MLFKIEEVTDLKAYFIVLVLVSTCAQLEEWKVEIYQCHTCFLFLKTF